MLLASQANEKQVYMDWTVNRRFFDTYFIYFTGDNPRF